MAPGSLALPRSLCGNLYLVCGSFAQSGTRALYCQLNRKETRQEEEELDQVAKNSPGNPACFLLLSVASLTMRENAVVLARIFSFMSEFKRTEKQLLIRPGSLLSDL